MKTKKWNLTQLKITSFTTNTLQDIDADTIKGGSPLGTDASPRQKCISGHDLCGTKVLD